MTNANAARRFTVNYAGQTFARTSKTMVYAFAIVGESANWHDLTNWEPACFGWSQTEAQARKTAAGLARKSWNRNVTIIPVGA